MSVTIEATPVARKSEHGGKRPGAGRPKKDRDDVAVKMDREMAALARFVAEMRGVPMAEYLDTFRAIVDRDFAKASKGLGKADAGDP